MKIKKRNFETNQYIPNKRYYSDFKIDMVKKYGVINLWRWWRTENGKYAR